MESFSQPPHEEQPVKKSWLKRKLPLVAAAVLGAVAGRETVQHADGESQFTKDKEAALEVAKAAYEKISGDSIEKRLNAEATEELESIKDFSREDLKEYLADKKVSFVKAIGVRELNREVSDIMIIDLLASNRATELAKEAMNAEEKAKYEAAAKAFYNEAHKAYEAIAALRQNDEAIKVQEAARHKGAENFEEKQ